MKENINDFLDKEFYIVDCYNFMYFPNKAKVIGIEDIGYNNEIRFIINVIDIKTKDYKRVYKEELKTFEEAIKCTKELNEIPENKKLAEQWRKNHCNLLRTEKISLEEFEQYGGIKNESL